MRRPLIALLAAGLVYSVIPVDAIAIVVFIGAWVGLNVLSPGSCPHCFKRVKFGAGTCRFCGKAIKPGTQPQ